MNTIKSPNPDNIHWSENIIIADADYIDYVAFNLIVNFERMLGRRIPPADLSRWAMDVALDGGLREGKHETQVVLIHEKGKTTLENFRPATYATDLNGKAFNDGKLGEFIINTIDAGDSNADKESIITDIMTMSSQPQGGEEDNGRARCRTYRHLAHTRRGSQQDGRRREAHYALRHAA